MFLTVGISDLSAETNLDTVRLWHGHKRSWMSKCGLEFSSL